MAELSRAQIRGIIAKAPRGSTPEGVIAALRREGHTFEGDGSTAAAGSGAQSAAPIGAPAPVDLRTRVLAGLPAAGALAGGTLGIELGPLGIAGGAAAGGATGRFLEQQGRRALGYKPSEGMIGQLAGIPAQGPVGETVDLATEAGLGALAEAPAMLLARSAGPLMRAAVPETRAAVREGMMRTAAGRKPLATTAETLLERKIPASRIALREARRASGKELHQLLKGAKEAGVTFDPGEFARGAIDVMEDVGGYPLGREARKKAFELTEKFLGDHPDVLDPVALKSLKQEFQKLAQRAYAAEKKGGGLVGLEDRFNDAIAKQARKALESIAGVARREQATQSLVRAERGVQEAGLRGPLRPFGAFGGGMNLPVLSAFGVPREAISRAALLAASPAASSTLRTIPRLLDVLIREGLISPEELKQP